MWSKSGRSEFLESVRKRTDPISLRWPADPIGVKVIPNGVDSSFVRPAEHRDERPFMFLLVGRFHAQKSLGFLVEAAAALRARTQLPVRVVFVGDGGSSSILAGTG